MGSTERKRRRRVGWVWALASAAMAAGCLSVVLAHAEYGAWRAERAQWRADLLELRGRVLDDAAAVRARADLATRVAAWAHADADAAHARVEDVLRVVRVVAATQGCRVRLPAMVVDVERPLVCDGWAATWEADTGDGACYGGLGP